MSNSSKEKDNSFLGCLGFLLSVAAIWILINSFVALFIDADGWLYYAAVILLIIISRISVDILYKKSYNLSRADKAIYDEALRKDEEDEATYKNLLAAWKSERDEKFNNEKVKIDERIAELTNQLQNIEKGVGDHTILKGDDKEYTKICRLIDYMESNRADSVKEALLLDDEKIERQKEAYIQKLRFDEQQEVMREMLNDQLVAIQGMAEENERHNEKMEKLENERLKIDKKQLNVNRSRLDTERDTLHRVEDANIILKENLK